MWTAYVDASGDEGFKFGRGSTIYYVVAVVLTENASRLNKALKYLRIDLGLPPNFEFKFSNKLLKEAARRTFFETLKNQEFKVRYLIVDKRWVTSPALMADGNLFRTYMTKLPLKVNWKSRRGVAVVLDGHKLDEGVALWVDKQYWLGQLNLPPVQDKISDIYLQNARTSSHLQIADMYAGAMRRRLEKGGVDYYGSIHPKIEQRFTFR